MALGVVFGQVLVDTPHPAMTAMTCPIETHTVITPPSDVLAEQRK